MENREAQLREAFLAKMRAEADEQIAYNKMVERSGAPEAQARWRRARARRDAIVERYAAQLSVAAG